MGSRGTKTKVKERSVYDVFSVSIVMNGDDSVLKSYRVAVLI